MCINGLGGNLSADVFIVARKKVVGSVLAEKRNLGILLEEMQEGDTIETITAPEQKDK